MTSTVPTYSPRYGRSVDLGTGQARALERLREIRRAHPSRTWHTAPTLRSWGVDSHTAHGHLRRLRELGVIALQSTLGRYGGIRYTLGVAPAGPGRRLHRGELRRWVRQAPGQLAAFAESIDPATAPPKLGDIATAPEWSYEAWIASLER